VLRYIAEFQGASSIIEEGKYGFNIKKGEMNYEK